MRDSTRELSRVESGAYYASESPKTVADEKKNTGQVTGGGGGGGGGVLKLPFANRERKGVQKAAQAKKKTAYLQ